MRESVLLEAFAKPDVVLTQTFIGTNLGSTVELLGEVVKSTPKVITRLHQGVCTISYLLMLGFAVVKRKTVSS